MKVCEWDNVSCPYCKENKEEYKDKLNNTYGLKELTKVNIRSSTIYMLAHHVTCFSCGGDFFIPCGD